MHLRKLPGCQHRRGRCSGRGPCLYERDASNAALAVRSLFRIQQAPCHRPNPIEEFEGSVGLDVVNCSSLGEESEMSIDFLCGAVCDSPVVHSVSARAPVAF